MPKIPNNPDGDRKELHEFQREHYQTLYIGVDPGQKGGIASVLQEAKGINVEVYEMPETENGVYHTLVNAVAWWGSLKLAVIEKVHSMPEQGVASSFKFGMGYGGLRMALIGAGIPFEEVDPRAWQKALGIPPRKKEETKPQFKLRLLKLAQQLYPSLPLWSEKKAKGRMLAVADALLIAEFCKRKHEGKL